MKSLSGQTIRLAIFCFTSLRVAAITATGALALWAVPAASASKFDDLANLVSRPNAATFRVYDLRDDQGTPGRRMEQLKILENPTPAADQSDRYLGVYQTCYSYSGSTCSRYLANLALSDDLVTWKVKQGYLADYATHPSLVALPGGGFLLAYQKTGSYLCQFMLRSNCSVLAYYSNLARLYAGTYNAAVELPGNQLQTDGVTSVCAEGTPSIYSVAFAGGSSDISQSSIDIGFHYSRDNSSCTATTPVDRQARGTLVAFDSSTWHPRTQPLLDKAVYEAATPVGNKTDLTMGNITSRDTMEYMGSKYTLLDGNLSNASPTDPTQWRIYLHDDDGGGGRTQQVQVQTDHGSTAFQRPAFTTVTDPAGRLAVVVTMWIPDQAAPAGSGEGGELLFYKELPRPNILFIVTDDQRSDTLEGEDPATGLAWMNNTLSWFWTGDPAQGYGGTKFTQGYATTPMCCPSRSSIFTGRYAHNHLVQNNDEATNLCSEQKSTLQYYLQQKGYYTGIFGKYLNGWVGSTPSAQGKGCLPEFPNKVPPYFNDYGIFETGYVCTTVSSSTGEPTIDAYENTPGCGAYSTSYVRDKALSFIGARASEPDRPWFLYLAPAAPHETGDCNGGSADIRTGKNSWDCRNMTYNSGYDGYSVPQLGPPLPEVNRTDKPAWVQGTPTARQGWSDRRRIFDSTYGPGLRSQMLRTLKPVDDLVDRVFAELRARGEADNTLAFFISDNGYAWREHGPAPQECWSPDPSVFGNPPPNNMPTNVPCGLSSKGQPYLQTIKVPLLMRWPGDPKLPSGDEDNRLVANIDLAPTVLDAAGIKTSDPAFNNPPPMDGRSLLDPYRRSHLLTEGYHSGATPPDWQSIVTPTYQYVHYNDNQPLGPGPFWEYYNLSSDSAELNNVYGPDGQPGTADDGITSPPPPSFASLQSQLDADYGCAGTSCP